MKRLFVLAVVLTAVINISRAQDYKMVVTLGDGTLELFSTSDVADVKFASDTWTAYAIGTYTYAGGHDNPLYPSGGEVSGYTLYRSDANTTRYYIADWGLTDAPIDFYFTYNETTGKALVDQQDLNYTDDYGRTYQVEDFFYYDEDDDYFEDMFDRSYYDAATQTFTFDLKYCPSNGGYVQTYETFRITEFLTK